MNTIALKAFVRNGRIDAKAPMDWPEGTEVFIEPSPRAESPGMREEDWPTTPESIARWIAEFEAIPPLVMSPQEESDMLAWRQKVKEFNVDAVRRQMAEGNP